jgi:hypothetical protein
MQEPHARQKFVALSECASVFAFGRSPTNGRGRAPVGLRPSTTSQATGRQTVIAATTTERRRGATSHDRRFHLTPAITWRKAVRTAESKIRSGSC